MGQALVSARALSHYQGSEVFFVRFGPSHLQAHFPDSVPGPVDDDVFQAQCNDFLHSEEPPDSYLEQRTERSPSHWVRNRLFPGRWASPPSADPYGLSFL